MDTTLILLCVLAFAFAVTHLERKLLGERVRFVSDAEYLLLGVAFGPLGLGVLGTERMAQLEPLQSVITGFVGFLVGLTLVRRRARGVGRADLAFSIAATLFTVIGVGAALLAAAVFLLPEHLQQPLHLTAVAAATLAFGSVAGSRSAVLHTIARTRADGPFSRLLPLAISTGRVVAVVGFGVTLAAKRALVEEGSIGFGSLVIPPGAWVFISVAAGVASAVIFRVFAGEESDRQRLFVATIGLVLLTSGIAHALEFSPLFVGAIAGATVANISPVASHVSEAATRLSHPTVVILLILAGAAWTPVSGILWVLPVGYVVLRMLALRLATGVAGAHHPALRGQSRPVGSGLVPMGALAVAIAVNYALTPDTAFTDAVVTTLLLTAIVGSLLGPASVRRLLRDVGETGRRGHADAPPEPTATEGVLTPATVEGAP